jgi:putative DNA primase/helicase
MTAETIAKALGGHRAGATWMARCPAHDDSIPSLAISTGKHGKVLVRCHAGCDQRDVIAALSQRGVWDATGKLHGGIARKHRKNLSPEPDADAKARTEAALAIWGPRKTSRARSPKPICDRADSRFRRCQVCVSIPA